MPLIPLIWIGGAVFGLREVGNIIDQLGDTADRAAPTLLVVGSLVVAGAGVYLVARR